MDVSEKPLVIITESGAVILPEALRRAREWMPGTSLTIEETPEGLLLKPAPASSPTRPEDVFGMLGHKGEPISVEDMEAGIGVEVRRGFGGR